MAFAYSVDPGPEEYPFTNTNTVIINHNLGYKPWVYIVLSDNIQSLSTVTHTNKNSLTVTFQNSLSGTVYLR
jgi:hypothetical protein